MSSGENEPVRSTSDIRPELERVGEVFLELLRPELQNLRVGIVGNMAKLQRASYRKVRQRVEARKRASPFAVSETIGGH
jgi:hypothetical protein